MHGASVSVLPSCFSSLPDLSGAPHMPEALPSPPFTPTIYIPAVDPSLSLHVGTNILSLQSCFTYFFKLKTIFYYTVFFSMRRSTTIIYHSFLQLPSVVATGASVCSLAGAAPETPELTSYFTIHLSYISLPMTTPLPLHQS